MTTKAQLELLLQSADLQIASLKSALAKAEALVKDTERALQNSLVPPVDLPWEDTPTRFSVGGKASRRELMAFAKAQAMRTGKVTHV